MEFSATAFLQMLGFAHHSPFPIPVLQRLVLKVSEDMHRSACRVELLFRFCHLPKTDETRVVKYDTRNNENSATESPKCWEKVQSYELLLFDDRNPRGGSLIFLIVPVDSGSNHQDNPRIGRTNNQ